MCGIAGILAPPSHDGDLHARVARMTRAIAYRGPDGDGHWVDLQAGIALGHRRLAIIDLSDAGAQPMQSRDGRWIASYNGEIYNCLELRQALDAEGGTRWHGHSDTEILLEAISRWGLSETLRRADGMFALALWDRQRGELQLARDRFGEKPLYVAWRDGRILFASELKALHGASDALPLMDRRGLAWLLALGYIPAPWTPFVQTFKLPPGHLLTLSAQHAAPDDAEGFAGLCKPFWSARAVAEEAMLQPRIDSAADAMIQIEERLALSVRRRMLSDVPFGAFLSGGIDSSLVTALMVKQSERPVQTFTIGFAEDAYDESTHAERVAGALGTKHHMQRLHADDALALVPELPTLFDEPLADASQLPTLLLSRFARGHVKVCLSGDGGDELFFGYQRHFNAIALWGSMGRVPQFLRNAAACAFLAWGRRSPRARRQRWRQASFLRSTSAQDLHAAMSQHWYRPGPVDSHLASMHSASLSGMHNMLLFDQQLYLANDLMSKTDRAAMSVGLETRMPFLEPSLAALAWRLSPSLLFRKDQGKWILRTLLARHLPRDIVERPKQGFGIPLDDWLRRELRTWGCELLHFAREQAAGIVDVLALEALWSSHQRGDTDSGDALWTALTLLNWLRAQPRIGLSA